MAGFGAVESGEAAAAKPFRRKLYTRNLLVAPALVQAATSGQPTRAKRADWRSRSPPPIASAGESLAESGAAGSGSEPLAEGGLEGCAEAEMPADAHTGDLAEGGLAGCAEAEMPADAQSKEPATLASAKDVPTPSPAAPKTPPKLPPTAKAKPVVVAPPKKEPAPQVAKGQTRPDI